MKNSYIQTIRGFLILFVIIIHSITTSNNDIENIFLITIRTICNIAVPIFIVLAGYFFNEQKYRENKKFMHEKILRLLIPLIIYNIIYFILSMKFNIANLLFFNTAAHLYYIVVIIQLILLTPLIIKYNSLKNLFLLITPIYLLVYRIIWMAKGQTIIPLHQYYFFAWSIYYVIGLIMKKKKLFNINKYQVLILFLLTISYNVFIYYKFGIDYSLSQMNIVNMLFSIVVALYLINNKKDNTKENIFSKIGDNSFGIYFIHLLVIIVLNKLLGNFNINPIIFTILKSFVTITLSYLGIKMFTKITKNKFNKFLGF